ncbi:anaerobic carbon-monoxide dehydrogenase catalytic subunit [Dehalococcoidia bacterium]|nr:anaerobic carbon-monoxide dehydrogenase catalytic subunit [Dehalococcoidia bacterium]
MKLAEVLHPEDCTLTSDGQAMLNKAQREGIETVWDRYTAQSPHCIFCETGLSCRICMMGPCRINPKKPDEKRGVCGADAHIIVARNFLRTIAAGAASHSDHGRELVEILKAVGEGRAPGYRIREPEKLKNLAAEYGIDTAGQDDLSIAPTLAEAMEEDFGTSRKSIRLINRAPEKRLELWDKLGIIPRGIDRETCESLHRTHMGVDNDWLSLLTHGLRNALADGWGGSLIGTELSDVLFGIPRPKSSEVNLAVLKEDQVNIVLHGHNPLVSEMIVQAAKSPELQKLATEQGAKGINLVGVCCTGNELLMRRGIPMAGNHLMTELVLVTGAVEALVVDYQCIMPSLGTIAQCYHTRMYSTSDKARFPNAVAFEMTPETALEKARQLVKEAVMNYPNRQPDKVSIPGRPVKQMTGFSVESLLEGLGGSLDPLLDAIKSGKIRGAIGIVGCNNPRIKHDAAHRTIIQHLIANDILVLDTGCVSVATAKAGLKTLDAIQQAGPGLKEICTAVGIPPVLHMGSCVDNSRILVLVSAIANALGTDISDLPVAAAAPEWYSEKAVTIGFYAVASGITTFLGPMPPITGSDKVAAAATKGLEDIVGACFIVEENPEKAANLMVKHIEKKRGGLGLDSRQ